MEPKEFMNFGLLSYGTAGVAFVLLASLLIVGRGGNERGGISLILVSLVTSGWGLLLAAASAIEVAPVLVYGIEILRGALWVVVLVAIGKTTIPRTLAAFGLLAVVAVILLFFLYLAPPLVGTTDAAVLMSRAGLLFATIGLMLLEQMYRNSNGRSRAAIMPFLIGVGLALVYDVFMYSQAELIHGIERNAWQARGFVNALAAPLIALAVRRNPQWSIAIFVSRHVVFHTTALVVVGSYVVLMGIGGYFIRVLGGAWGAVAEVVFLVGAMVALFGLLFSGAMRRKLTVFISKHFYRNKYDYRVEWLRFIQTLSANDEGNVKRTAVRAVAQIFSCPGGVLLLLDDSGCSFVPAAAWPMRLDALAQVAEIPASSDLAGFLSRKQWIVDMEEFRRKPEFYDGISMPGWIGATAELRLISPMLELDRLVGIFLLYNPPPPFRLTYEDRDLLKTVGQHLATQIGQHEADRKLAEARQFEAYNKLTAFMMHDLKNSVAQLQLVVTNAERHKRNPEFIDDALSTVANAAGRMARLIEHLKAKDERRVLSPVSLTTLVAAAVERCSDRRPIPTYSPVVDHVAVRADPERLGAVLEHVIRNAQDASGPEQAVEVSTTVAGNEAMVTVVDVGSGMSPEFVRERLFRPFDSTKGSKGMGIGAYQTREYVRMLGGDVKVQSSPGNGTKFSITLPCVALTDPVAMLPVLRADA